MSYHSDLFFNVWTTLVQQLNPSELEEVAVTLRGIWTKRNEVLHGKGFIHPIVLSQKAKAKVSSFQEVNKTSQLNPVQATQRVHKWSKPVEGSYKAN